MFRRPRSDDFLRRGRPGETTEKAMSSALEPVTPVRSPLEALAASPGAAFTARLIGGGSPPPILAAPPIQSSLADSSPKQSREAWIGWITKQDRERPLPRQFIERWRAKGWPHLGATSDIPTLSDTGDRINSIVADRPARFNIVDNTYDSGDPQWYADDEFGLGEVRIYDQIIEEEANRQGVDPNLVRAIVFVENSHGWYDGYIEPFGLNLTIRPMNINPDLWHGLGISRQTAEDPRMNIRIGTTLLRRLVDRIEEPTPRKVAALWHLIGAEHTDNEDIRNYVARVGQLYGVKPWANPIPNP